MGETPQQILERYVWRVTGLTPERRAMTRARYDIDRAGAKGNTAQDHRKAAWYAERAASLWEQMKETP